MLVTVDLSTSRLDVWRPIFLFFFGGVCCHVMDLHVMFAVGGCGKRRNKGKKGWKFVFQPTYNQKSGHENDNFASRLGTKSKATPRLETRKRHFCKQAKHREQSTPETSETLETKEKALLQAG